jgi:ubiquinone/menaquinone biosynthesis C-methylase UbiE
VGYGEWLEAAPAEAGEAFAGVSNVAVAAPLEEGMRVLDLGCGAGLDSWIAERRVGRSGRVWGVDFSGEMLRRGGARSVVQAAAEELPLRAAVVDMALVNGIFNLNPRRDEIYRELARVVKPGGSVFGAELVLQAELPAALRAGTANWFS